MTYSDLIWANLEDWLGRLVHLSLRCLISRAPELNGLPSQDLITLFARKTALRRCSWNTWLCWRTLFRSRYCLGRLVVHGTW